jgi:plasmid stability protein
MSSPNPSPHPVSPGGFRCSEESAVRDEPMFGTASTVRSWLLLEHPGPWGRFALPDSRLPDGLGDALRIRAAASGVRVLLIRRPGRSAEGSTGALAIRSGPEEPRIERVDLARLEAALELELERLGRGEPLGVGIPHEGAVFLVCTHGRHDPCCAERGRPVAAALSREFPDETWESSHFGGDRFAGNLVVFPHGFYFGRLRPHESEAVARTYLDGRLDLERLRGRSCRPMPVQAAEHFLREHAGLDRIDDVEPEAATTTPSGARVRFRTSAGRGRFDVHIAREPDIVARRLTCHSQHEERPPTYRLLAIKPLLS